MKLRVGSATDIGRARERNEDSMLVKDRMFAVADGMGGHRGGEVASALSLEGLEAAEVSADGPLAQLVQEVKAANRAVFDRGEKDRELQGMGTTLTAVVVDDETGYLAHVGDSRAYLLREGALQQLTEDHTLVQRLVREGKITAEQAEQHPQRNILTRVLGVDDELEPYELTFDLHDGDRILICSDGLTGMLRDHEIQRILESEPDPQRAAEHLVASANQAGGDDNITVIVLDVGEAPVSSGSSAGASNTATNAREAAPVRNGPRPGVAQTGVITLPAPAAEASADAPRPHGDRPSRRGRAIAWGGLALVVVVALLLAGRIYVSHQWYVGEWNGTVAIYQGVPASPLGFDLSHVERSTHISAADAERLQQWQTLKDGITAESLDDAQSIVNQIEQDLGAAGGAATP